MEAPGAARPAKWHAIAAEQCLALAGSSPAGLSEEQAEERLARCGRNELPRPGRVPWPILFFRQFRSPLIYLLLAAAIVSLAVGEPVDAAFIGAVLMVHAAIGGFQEWRAQTNLAALHKLIRVIARVRRNARVRMIEAGDIVVGDIVEVESGMAVPADVRLLSSQGLAANESLLSGESLPAAKDAAVLADPGAGLGDRPNMLHAGTTVAEGRAIGLVVATGSDTSLGAIEASLSRAPPSPPPLVLRLARLTRQIGGAVLLLTAMVAAILLATGAMVEQVLLLSVALIVSAIPEGLPVAVTVALAAATSRMARRQVIVRALPAVEGLGACTLIASDKTGTLTMNRLTVERVLLPSGMAIERGAWRSGAGRRIALAAALCNEAAVQPDGSISGDAVDVALLRFARDAGEDPSALARRPRLATLPYEPARRFAAVTVRGSDGDRIYVKGAPEVVLPMCADVVPTAHERAHSVAAEGYRLLAVAEGAAADGRSPAAPTGLSLLGFVALVDPLRPEAADAIARCADAGVEVRMITGDHPATACTIARKLGMNVTLSQVVTGADLAALAGDPDGLRRAISGGRVFARIEPGQKLLIVEMLAALGEWVAVTGDGVNDAPALKAAHIGVAMGKDGTDVARDAADLVLADDNFASIVNGIEEGRITYANMRKIVIFLLATGCSELFMFIGALATGLPLPLTPVQLIWANVVTEGVQDVMLGFGKGEGDELKRPPRRPREPLLDRTALALMVPAVIVMTLLGLLLVDRSVERGLSLAATQNAVLLLVVLFQNAFAISIRSERRPIHREPLRSNPWLLVGIAAALGLQVLAMYWAPLAGLLGTGPVDGPVLWFCLASLALFVVTVELSKAAVVRGRQRRSRA